MTDAAAPHPDPTTPDASGSRRGPRRGRVVAVLLVLVVVVAVVAAVLFALDARGGAGADPEQTVQRYDKVFKDADCEGFNELTTSSFRDELKLTTCAAFDNNAKDGAIATFRLTVTSSTVDGDSASVRTRETFESSTGQQSIDLVYSLVKDDGAWKVDQIARDQPAA